MVVATYVAGATVQAHGPDDVCSARVDGRIVAVVCVQISSHKRSCEGQHHPRTFFRRLLHFHFARQQLQRGVRCGRTGVQCSVHRAHPASNRSRYDVRTFHAKVHVVARALRDQALLE
eukprot:CAMPEP_0184973056 /NCGR_PEP_ID=MMETSP1098-20130426/4962_1 /TAXON_ID=89044 /ORGANISM="Spumella elongata, Strain CCAP 955/1" /LENGTH=117 /DNA_ID=CAMNT_0027495479 /DNA_START=95 /DNA_END=448 /DNA_ORIENTATION=-